MPRKDDAFCDCYDLDHEPPDTPEPDPPEAGEDDEARPDNDYPGGLHPRWDLDLY